MHYLDNAATTQVDAAVVDVITAALAENWGNPSSLYTAGMQAEQTLDAARRILADAMGCQPKEVTFTASGTESNHISIMGAALARKNWGKELVFTGYEHPCVSGPMAFLAEHAGFTLREIPPGPDGQIDTAQLLDAVTPQTALVCAMQVNNETGSTLDITALAAAVKQRNPRCYVHVDGVQGFCKLPLVLKNTQIDGYAVSGHKLHAPKGIGALYLRSGSHIKPVILGGGQENGLRSGTQNTPYIAGFAKAVQLAKQQQPVTAAQVTKLRRQLLDGLARLGGFTIHSPQNGYPGIVFFSMPSGLRSQVMLNLLDQQFQVCVSSGSACSGSSGSHTLTAMGVPAPLIDSALRVSFCHSTTPQDVDALLAGLEQGIHTLARR